MREFTSLSTLACRGTSHLFVLAMNEDAGFESASSMSLPASALARRTPPLTTALRAFSEIFAAAFFVAAPLACRTKPVFAAAFSPA